MVVWRVWRGGGKYVVRSSNTYISPSLRVGPQSILHAVNQSINEQPMSVAAVGVDAGSLGRIHEWDVSGFVESQRAVDANRPIDVMCCSVSGSLQSVQRERASLSSLAAPLAKLHA
jgi:hypothetical protein